MFLFWGTDSLDGNEVGDDEIVQVVWAGSEAVIPQLQHDDNVVGF